MSGIEIRFEIKENLTAALQRGIDAGSDFTPAMMEIANHLSTATRLRFEREQAPDGSPWKPSRRALEEGGQTLTMKGDLKGSIAPDWGRDFAAAGPERSGGAAIYAAIHQFGGIIVPRVKRALSFGGRIFAKIIMPARPYLGFDDIDRSVIPEILSDHLRSAFKGSGA
jgi:phage virion morphogenesis protein